MSRTRNPIRLAVVWVVGASVLCATMVVSCAPGPKSATAPSSSSALRPELKTDTILRDRIFSAIESARTRDLLTTHGFWTVFHGILGLGLSVTLQNPETGQKFNALDYIAAGHEVRGLQFIQTKFGLDVRNGYDFVGQGHQDQFIAEMAQWGIAADKKFVVNGKDYTYMDFVRHAQMRAKVTSNQELSWAIVVIGQYLGTDISWTNGDGEKLTYEDVVRYELNQPIESPSVACGGTHRLFGLTWAYYHHLRNGGRTTGIWKDVVEHSRKYEKLAKKFQNPDGSFSTNHFRERGNAPDIKARISTTGHILEWLALSLSDQELREPWVQEAANSLADMFLTVQDQEVEGGAMYHAVHGLILYYARVYDAERLGPNRPFLPLPPSNTWVCKVP